MPTGSLPTAWTRPGCRRGVELPLRRALSSAALVTVLLGGLGPLTVAAEQAELQPKAPIPIVTILATPDKFEGTEVTVRGAVVSAKRAVFPNGRSYYTLSLGDERAAITVFSWERPSVEPGDQVEVMGVFHRWRYNLPRMIESLRITRVRP